MTRPHLVLLLLPYSQLDAILSQSINQSNQIYIAPYVASESEAQSLLRHH